MPSKQDIERIKSGLGSWSSAKRKAMIDYVRALSHEDAVVVAMSVYEVERADKWYHNWQRLQTALLIGLQILAPMGIAYWLGKANIWVIPTAAAGFSAFVATLALLRRGRTMPIMIISHSILTADQRLVAPMLRCFALSETSVRQKLYWPLSESLSLLSRDGYYALTLAERTSLHQLLTQSHIPLQKSVIEAIGHAEDTSAIPSVHKLATSSDNFSVHRAARVCLDRLVEIHEVQKIGATLLRPSQPDAAPDNLLRAASTSDEQDEKLLLRPDEG